MTGGLCSLLSFCLGLVSNHDPSGRDRGPHTFLAFRSVGQCNKVETDSIVDAPTELLIDLWEQELVPLSHTAESGARHCGSTPVEDTGQMTRRLRSAVQSQLSMGVQQSPQQPYSPEPVTRRAPDTSAQTIRCRIGV